MKSERVEKLVLTTSYTCTVPMLSWKPPAYSVLDVDDFIIADDDEEETTRAIPQSSATNSHPSTNPNPTPNPTPNFFSSFTPKLDLNSFTSGLATNTAVSERQYSGGDTLDEPIWHTLRRDLAQIGRRLAIVVWPMQLQSLAQLQQQRLVSLMLANGINVPGVMQVSQENIDSEEGNVPRNDTLEWDLWGPLIFLLTLAVALGMSASRDQTNAVFSGTFCFTWISFLVLGLNIQLLGGTISFLLAISATGYSMFPLVLGELLSWLVIKHKFLRLILMVVLNAWSVFAGAMSLKCSGVLPGKVLLAVYPVALMYSVISWLVVIT